ncbi:MAG: phosphoribosylglycinamide formyltransferase [Acidobacteria bacterium]|nr:phosphoribosylglycinamide formyltransferase [Acidobacteriota bacterium]
MKKGRVGILLSGRGSNFEAIYQFSLREDACFEIATVVSDKEEARGLARASELGLPAFFVSAKTLRPKENYERRIVTILKEHGVELVCLAGYMRIVGRELLNAYPGRIMNIHPALLPAFPGLDAQRQALEYGVKVSGCTVHFVDPGIDSGPIILQAAVEVMNDDTEETLSHRILSEEHKIYSRAITLFFENRLQVEGRRVIISS